MKSRFFRWIRYWMTADRVATRRPGRRPLAAEMLEDRTLPAPIVWTGAVDHSFWTTPGNWDLARVPALGDDVSIGNGDTVLFNTTVEVTSLALATGSGLNVVGGALTLDAASTLSGSVSFSSGTLEAKGSAVLAGNTSWTSGFLTSTSPGSWTNNGVISISGANFLDLGGTLNNAGMITQSVPISFSQIRFHDAALNNSGLYDFQVNHTPMTLSSGVSSFNNLTGGIVRKSGPATVDVTDLGSLPFNNAAGGIIDVQTGTLNLSGGGTQQGGVQSR